MQTFVVSLLIAFLVSVETFAQNARMLGQVLGSENEPLPAVTIYIVNSSYAQATLTNARGYYTFLDVPPGKYTMKAIRRGVTLQEKTISTIANTITRVDLKIKRDEPALAANKPQTEKPKPRAKPITLPKASLPTEQAKPLEEKPSEPQESEEASSQSLSEEDVAKDKDLTEAVETAKSVEVSDVTKVDTKPEVIGGMETINRKIVYPEALREKGLQGGVIAKVSVDQAGNPTKVLILKATDPMFSEEVFRVLSQDIKFKPATLNGKPVASAAVIFVEFKLN